MMRFFSKYRVHTGCGKCEFYRSEKIRKIDAQISELCTWKTDLQNDSVSLQKYVGQWTLFDISGHLYKLKLPYRIRHECFVDTFRISAQDNFANAHVTVFTVAKANRFCWNVFDNVDLTGGAYLFLYAGFLELSHTLLCLWVTLMKMTQMATPNCRWPPQSWRALFTAKLCGDYKSTRSILRIEIIHKVRIFRM